MKKRPVSVVTYFVLNFLVLSSLLISTPTTALACEDEPPQTLLQLYKGAEMIYIATYAKLEKGELVTVEGENYRFHPTKQHFDISQTLKGQHRKFFVLEGEEYVYDAPEAPEGEAEPPVEHSDENVALVPSDVVAEGDTVILFLNKDPENAEKIVLSHYRDSIKEITPDSVGSYEKRFRELSSIFAAKKVSDAKIVEWLVRLAEDPATRWEGTYELSQSFSKQEWKASETERRAKSGEEPMNEEELSYYASSVYATLLTDTQKQRLSEVLLSVNTDAPEGEKPSFRKGDLELVELVKRWGNTQTAVFFLDKLRMGAHSAEENSQMMASAARILRDAELEKLAGEYMDIAWRSDDEPVETEEPAAEPEAVEVKAEGTTPVEGEAPAANAEAEAKRTVTYKERRDSITASFLARASVVMANGERAMTAARK